MKTRHPRSGTDVTTGSAAGPSSVGGFGGRFSWLGWAVLLGPLCIICFVIAFGDHPWVAKQSELGARAAAAQHLSFGREEMKQGNLEKAYSHYRRALVIEPDCAEAYVMISQLHYKAGDLDGAIAKLEEAIELNSPQRDLIYNNLGLLYAKTERYREALQMFQRSLDSGMRTGVIYKNIGNVYLSLRQYDKAITAYKNALDYRADIRTIYSDMLREAAEKYYGDEEHEAPYDAAVAHLERGVSDEDLRAYDNEIVELYVSKTPKSAEDFFNLGRAYHLKQDLDNAINSYTEALKIDPQSERVRKSLVAAYSQAGDVEKASALGVDIR